MRTIKAILKQAINHLQLAKCFFQGFYWNFPILFLKKPHLINKKYYKTMKTLPKNRTKLSKMYLKIAKKNKRKKHIVPGLKTSS